MTVSNKGLNIIKKHEGRKLTAYICPAGKPTIGYGNTFYANGKPVKMGDKITKLEAESLLVIVVNQFASRVLNVLKKPVTQNQFDALVSFAYNTGIGNFSRSTLLRKVNANPNDATIAGEFAKWNKGGGVVLRGLTRRRKEESDLYFAK